jgi:hypothetical protein
MQISATSSTKEWAIPAADNYPAVCIRIIDLGTQENKKFDNKSRKAKFVFELIGTEHIFKEELGPQPFIVAKDYTQSIGEKSNLRKDCESWLNRTLTEAELKNFDLNLMLGKPCFVTVIHNTGTDKKTYANIKSITAPMKGFKVDPPKNDIFLFEIGTIGWEEVYNKLWDADKKKIALSPEYKDAMLLPG